MNFVVYMFLIATSLIGVLFYNKLIKTKISIYDITRVFIYFLISNILCISIIYFIKGSNYNIFVSVAQYPLVLVKYSIISIVANMFVAYIDAFLSKNFDIYFEVTNEKKNNKNK